MSSEPDIANALLEMLRLDLPQRRRAQQAADLIREATGQRWVGVYAVGEDEVVNLAWSGAGPPTYPRFPVDAGLTARAIASATTVVSNDVAGDPGYLEALGTTASELIAPVVVDGRVVGTLDVESDRRDAFAPRDRATFERLAATLSDLYRSAPS
jgi:GAF domain-containing protein